jgi:putative oxidoreductase
MKRFMLIVYWIARLVAAVILLQTLFFKFTAAEESVYIFTTVGMEPWGRIGVGILELVAAILLIVTATAWIGGILALGLMLGAIGMHLTILGIEVKDDGGYLFILAVIVALCCAYVVIRNATNIISSVSAIRKRFN